MSSKRADNHSQTRISSHTKHGQKACSLGEIVSLVGSPDDASLDTVVVVENLSLLWAKSLADAWNMDWDFFEAHATNPRGRSSTWDAIFGPTPWERPEGRGNATARRSSTKLEQSKSGSTENSWHVDGIFFHGEAYSRDASELVDPNFMPRLIENAGKYGWQASTRISCYVKANARCRIYLILIDAPMTWLPRNARDGIPVAELHLPLALNRGGLVIPLLLEHGSIDLWSIMEQFLSHTWHLNLLFSTELLSPETLFHLLVASTCEQNLRFLDRSIKRLSFKDIRRPNSLVNDRMHDLREQLATLQDCVSFTRKWIPPSVGQELSTIAASSKSAGSEPPYIGYLEETLPDMLERGNALGSFLMESFRLLISSTNLMNAESDAEQAKRTQRLTVLAFLYVPLSFVTGAFGMNIKHINDSPVWAPIAMLAVTAVCTAIAFFVVTRWQVFRKRVRSSRWIGKPSRAEDSDKSMYARRQD
ncbi:Magnesium transport protein CorA [Zymoseptoria brevis]|uniref:Magnesium transport protein CorA n=1 Tax=Zymoseptoria brevis TaxID=1047168 RepID=A0A0F4G8F1_9PEZI|nr:Magnesium transport protein CorA [Zymoseptoria brevis]